MVRLNQNVLSLLLTMRHIGWEVLDISISHDNAKFASVGGDKAVFLWDVATAKTLRRFLGHTHRVNACDFNADASVLASGSYDATVRIWDCKYLSSPFFFMIGFLTFEDPRTVPPYRSSTTPRIASLQFKSRITRLSQALSMANYARMIYEPDNSSPTS